MAERESEREKERGRERRQEITTQEDILVFFGKNYYQIIFSFVRFILLLIIDSLLRARKANGKNSRRLLYTPVLFSFLLNFSTVHVSSFVPSFVRGLLAWDFFFYYYQSKR